MPEHYDLLIRGGTCVLPWGEAEGDVGIRARARSRRWAALSGASGAEVIDAKGLHVLPGLIDPHVHFRDPGDASVETVATGSKAAVLGGLAAVFDMPNTVARDHQHRSGGVEAGLCRARSLVRHGAVCRRREVERARAGGAGAGRRGVRRQGVRRQLHGRPAGGGRRHAGSGDAERAAAHLVSQRGRVPVAGTQADVQAGRPVLEPCGVARRGMRVPGHKAAAGAGPQDGAARAHPACVPRRRSWSTWPPSATSPRRRCWSTT